MMWLVKNDDDQKGKLLGLRDSILVSKSIGVSTISSPFYTCIQKPTIIPWTNPKDGSVGAVRTVTAPSLVSTRWNPTPEQLEALGEIYRRGTRTPTAEQIQQITARLKRFGKIEGKNVFYWFQNHKARERQKKRRDLELGRKAKQAATMGLSGGEEDGRDKSSSTWSSYKGSASVSGEQDCVWWRLECVEKQTQTSNPSSAPNGFKSQTSQTLELFPLVSGVDTDRMRQSNSSPTHFIEFLPTKK